MKSGIFISALFTLYFNGKTLSQNPINAVYSSCTRKGVTKWNTNRKIIPYELESWLHSCISVSIDALEVFDGVQSVLYDPGEKVVYDHWFWHNDVSDQVDYVEDEDRKVRFISNFDDGVAYGLSWQWRSKRKLEGMMYGVVDHAGSFTGDNIVFVYPDFLTGLQGTFLDGVLVKGRAVDIIGERCNNGIKELKLRSSRHDSHIEWYLEPNHEQLTLPHVVGQHPTVIEPFERKSVYIDKSTTEGANEGLFAKRHFRPGDLVSYFSGQRTLQDLILHDNMTFSQMSEAGSYYFNLWNNCVGWWNCTKDVMLEIPYHYRSYVNFRRTLGHKANHKFEENNVFYETLFHPALGPIPCLVADREIHPGDEIFSDYMYELESADNWYRQQYYEVYGTTEDNLEETKKGLVRN